MTAASTPLTTMLVDGKSARLELDAAQLKVVAGPDRGLVIPMPTDSLIIGSSSSCELVLHDTTVSARHAEISVTRQGYVMRDLGSTNGLMLGSTRVFSAPLCDGMRLGLGQSVIQVRATGKRHSLPLAAAGDFHGLVSESLKMRALVSTLETLAKSEVSVLVEGETGSGKEMVAAALHTASQRATGPFVVFDCGAVVPELVASELFGHEAGAYTGAARARAGLLEEADGGTLFLDEIAELPIALQPMLLRALEQKRSRKIGSNKEIGHDLRVVAATHRNLAEAVRAGEFREDLYYRLSAARIKVPPLRERKEDLPKLIDHFARELGAVIAPEARIPLAAYDWPGNVRELRNSIAQMAARQEGEFRPPVSVEDDVYVRGGHLRALSQARQLVTEEFERRYLDKALAYGGGNLTRAAELAQVSLRFLQRLAAKYGVRIRALK
jgi:DNA-binding NtrC family response regulator